MTEPPLINKPPGARSARSPTLSEISMILPDSGGLRSLSPPPLGQRPPSPSAFYAHSNRSMHAFRLDTAAAAHSTSPRNASPSLSTQSSRSTLRNTRPAAAAATTTMAHDDNIASSPTTYDGLLNVEASNSNGNSPSRRLSTTSSLNSEDLENIRNRWPGFDGESVFDDSGVDLEDEENQHQAPVARTNTEPESDQWPDGRNDEDGDTYSSDLYSKRAEMILANAKKRLNVMEGNLRGARQSLVVSPTFSPTIGGSKMTADLQHQIAAARDRDRRLYAGMGPIPPRSRMYHSSPLSANGSPGHSRGMSETSVPLPFSLPSYMAKAQQSKQRSSSAMGQSSGPWSPEGYGNGRFPIRESRSFDVMRDPRGTGVTQSQDDQDYSLRTHSRGSRSPPNALETLPEDEPPSLHRPPSVASSLRDQVKDLKGRISSLRLKTQEDSMRRRSQQSLRAPSPFTSAETWYSGTEAYKTPGSPISANAGVGFTLESPSRKALYEDERSESTAKEATEDHANHSYAVQEINRSPMHEMTEAQDEYDSNEDQWEEPEDGARNVGLGLDLDEEDEEDFDGASSIYEDAVYEMPATERHEDRIDAFDYENFFLHSAMGTYTAARPGSSSSTSSVSSTATTRPAGNVHTRNVSSGSAKRVSMHIRNSSSASVSTVASFATATEGLSDDEDENPQMDQFSQQLFPTAQQQQQSPPQLQPPPSAELTPTGRSDSAVNVLKPASSPALSSNASRVSSPASGDLVTGLQTSKIFHILTTVPRDEPHLALNEEEKQLIYSLAASFQQVCSNLRDTHGDQYERREWRRRLDEARRVLNGEDGEGQPF